MHMGKLRKYEIGGEEAGKKETTGGSLVKSFSSWSCQAYHGGHINNKFAE